MDHIDVKNLSVGINDYVILRSVSFVVNKGQCVGLIGKNGAGKTTLLRAMQGL
jgi:ABC-type cobalamin/Fe3+-siderophores transport system ATPase subunit